MTRTIKLYRLMVEDLWDGTRQYPNKDTFYETELSAKKAGAKWVKNYPDYLIEEGEEREKVLRTYVCIQEIVIIGGSID